MSVVDKQKATIFVKNNDTLKKIENYNERQSETYIKFCVNLEFFF